MKRRLLLSLLILAAAHTATAERYLVRLKEPLPGTAETAARGLGRAHEVEITNVYSHVFNGFAFRGDDAAARAIARNPLVRRVGKGGMVRLAGTQSPAPSWGLDRIDQRFLPLSNSYTYPETGSGSVIYVIDSGVNAVSELSGRIAGNYNFVHFESRTDDCQNHGTKVAVIAAGTTYGVAKGASIVNMRAWPCSGNAYESDVLDALDAVYQSHSSGQKTIVNMSLKFDSISQEMTDAIEELVSAGVTVVAAAGESVDACNISPAHMGTLGGAITVSSSGSSDEMVGAGYGQCVDIYAPTGVTTVDSGGSTVTFSGTSASVPHVSGAMALLQERHNTANPATLEGLLKDNASKGVLPVVSSGSPNLLLYTLPSIAVATGAQSMIASTTTTASVTPVSGATYQWSVANGSVVSGQGTSGITFRAGCSGTVGPAAFVTTGSGTISGMAGVAITRPDANSTGTYLIHPGQSVSISAGLSGVGPFAVTWADGFFHTVSSSPATRTVSPTCPGGGSSCDVYYRVSSLADAYQCSGTTQGLAKVMIRP